MVTCIFAQMPSGVLAREFVSRQMPRSVDGALMPTPHELVNSPLATKCQVLLTRAELTTADMGKVILCAVNYNDVDP